MLYCEATFVRHRHQRDEFANASSVAMPYATLTGTLHLSVGTVITQQNRSAR